MNRGEIAPTHMTSIVVLRWRVGTAPNAHCCLSSRPVSGGNTRAMRICHCVCVILHITFLDLSCASFEDIPALRKLKCQPNETFKSEPLLHKIGHKLCSLIFNCSIHDIWTWAKTTKSGLMHMVGSVKVTTELQMEQGLCRANEWNRARTCIGQCDQKMWNNQS